MKNISTIFVFVSLAFFSISAIAQENIIKIYPAGFMYNSGDFNSGADYQFKWGYERVFTNKISAEFGMGIVFQSYKYETFYGTFKAKNTLFLAIDPQFNYYILDDAPNGLYVGGFFTVGFGSVFMGGGAHAGYQMFFLDDKLAVDARLGLGGGGYISSNGTGGGGFHMPFEVGAGYRF